MKDSMTVRDTGIPVVDVLKLLGEGVTYRQTLERLPVLTLTDLVACIKTAATIIEQYILPQGSIQICGQVKVAARDGQIRSLQEIQKKHPRAFARWTPDEENRLVDMFKRGERIRDIAEAMERLPGGIRARLEKLGLIEPSPYGLGPKENKNDVSAGYGSTQPY
jgi:hypothetical protein